MQEIGEEKEDYSDMDVPDEEDLDDMFDDGKHFMGQPSQGKSLAEDCVGFVADNCTDLEQFISKMDDLVLKSQTGKEMR